MRFASESPIEIQLLSNHRIVVLASHDVYFSYIKSMNEHVRHQLVGSNPIRMYYSSQSSQVLILTNTSIEIFYSDWSSYVEVRKILILCNEEVYGVGYCDSIWKIYGNLYHYSTNQIEVVKVSSPTSTISGFLSNCQFTIVNRRLYQIFHSPRKIRQVQIDWKERLMVTANLKDNIFISCMHNSNYTVLCIAQTYILIIKDSKVTKTIERNEVFYFENNVIVSRGRNGFRVDRVTTSGVEQLGITQAPDGILYSACIYQQQLVFIMYHLSQIKPKTFNLVITETNDRKAHQLSFDSFHKAIPEQANQSGSQLISLADLRPSNRVTVDYLYPQNQMEEEFELMAGSEHSNQANSHKILTQDQILQNPILNNLIRQQESVQYKQNQKDQQVISPTQNIIRQLQDLSAINFKEGDTWGQLMMNKFTDPNQKIRKSSFESIKFNEKTYAFSLGRSITPQLIDQIDKKKFCSLLMQVKQKKPAIFLNYLERYLNDVLDEQQVSILFYESVRTSEIQSTKKILSKMYSMLPNNHQSKYRFSKALKQFRLVEVPFNCLPIQNNALQIIYLLHPNIAVGDILQNGTKVFSQILEQYFICQQLPTTQIRIQDQTIEISHPRNLLNVLLYLGSIFETSLNDLFTVYITKILKFGHVEVIRKIIEQENVLSICQVSLEVAQKAIYQFVFHFLKDSYTSLQFISEVINLVKGPMKKQLLLIFSIVSYLFKYDLVYSVDTLFLFKQSKSIGLFLSEVIAENTTKNLSQIHLPTLYRKLWELKQDQILKFYNYELIYLMQSLAEKLIEQQLIRNCFEVLNPISSVIRRGFIAKLLIIHANGKLVNRLINRNLQQTSLSSIFPQIFKMEDYTTKKLRSDSLHYPQQSDCFACSWEDFEVVFEKILFLSSEVVKVVVYRDINLASELVEYECIQQSDFNELLIALRKYLIADFPLIPQKPSPNTLTNLPIASLDNAQSRIYDQTPSSQLNSPFGQFTDKKNRQAITKSLTFIKLSDEDLSDKAQSVIKENSIEQNNSKLNYLHIVVDQDANISCLRQIYQEQARQSFIKALSIVQNKGIKLYHLEAYKLIICQDIKFSIERVLPFDIFLIKNKDQAFEISRERIMSQITIRNFWIIYLIIQIVFDKGLEVIQILIEKIIKYEKSDDYYNVVDHLIHNYTLPIKFIHSMRNTARQHSLTKTIKLFPQ